jgi:hypothetical protein
MQGPVRPGKVSGNMSEISCLCSAHLYPLDSTWLLRTEKANELNQYSMNSPANPEVLVCSSWPWPGATSAVTLISIVTNVTEHFCGECDKGVATGKCNFISKELLHCFRSFNFTDVGIVQGGGYIYYLSRTAKALCIEGVLVPK